MRIGEILRSYASQYWELYNEIGGSNEKIVARTFRMGLPENFELWELLTRKPPEDMRQLMRRVEEYKRLEDDWLQSKGKAPLVAEQDRGDPSRRNQNLHCTYHRDKGHTTEQCRVLKNHLEQLVKAGHLKEFVVDSRNRGTRQGAQQRGNPLPPPLGVIEVIHAAPRGTTVTKTGVLTVVPVEDCPDKQPSKKRTKLARETLAIDDDDDLEGTIQPHDDALVVTT
ncbi:uncharacterized protein LOC115966765 [Quercus lobata]|uniref:uncharacterized protein LOC115966765 n=1 Tax=Quercus lobata TaxID=97700 RepID=UPI001248019B|nr:uncharacterized protein LOC115966765 [Quercus lobata]